MKAFAFCYMLILPALTKLLKNENNTVTHEELKGTLHVLLLNKSRAICLKQNWETLNLIWPGILTSQYSEKPSIVALIQTINNSTMKLFETCSITTEIPNSCLTLAEKLNDNE